MHNFLETSAYFGLVLTILCFWFGRWLSQKTRLSILNPILIAMAIIIALLVFADIEYTTYESGANMIYKLLTPATICYAVPLYRQIQILKDRFAAIIISVVCGCIASILCVFGFSLLFNFEPEIYYAILPKSVTTAIGLGLSEEMGGLVPITIAAIIITGIFGNIAAVTVCRICKITHPVAIGLGIGTSSHAIGTSKAIEIGEVEGAISGLALVIAGLMTVVLAPLAAGWI